MLYEKYQRKIIKISSVLKWIRCHRALIIIATVIFLALLSTLLSVKGIIYYEKEISDEITYGLDAPYRANAFLEKINYEYAVDGTDQWTTIQPRHPGTYKVRAMSKRTFGTPSYGKVKVYKIVPKEIDVNLLYETVEYGEKPALSAELMFEDSINCSLFYYDDISQETTKVTADKNSIVITDKLGNNVVDSYIINVITSDITFTKRKITVTVEDATTVYDGTPLSYNGCEVSKGSLANGDNLIATFDKELVDAGEIENTAELKIASEKGVDVTKHYDVEKLIGKLTVEKRPVYIETQSAEKIYDGQALVYDYYEISLDTPLISGHSLLLTGNTSLTDVGTCQNLLTFKIMEGETDVTKNYSFLFPDSRLEILPRTLKIKTEDDEKIYDGLPLTNNNYTIVSEINKLDNHQLNVIFNGSQIQAGSSNNTIKEVIVTDGEKIVTQNYDFEYIFGTLSVNSLKIEICTANQDFVYNGKAQYNKNFEIMSEQGLVEGESIQAAKNSWATITNIGEAENKIEVRIFDKDGIDVSDCYDINYVYGKLTMKQCQITVTTATADFYYNAQEQFNNFYTIYPYIANDHKVVISDVVSFLKDVEKLENGKYKEYDNEFSISIFSGLDDVTYNYLIIYKYGTLRMLPRLINVTTGTKEFTYNGQNQFDNSFIIDSSLEDGHTAKIISNNTVLKEVERLEDGTLKEYENNLSIAVFNNGIDVSDNYSINYIYGKLTIKPRPVTITTSSNSWQYDGNAFWNLGYEISLGSLVEGHETVAVLDTLTKITDVVRLESGIVGSIENRFKIAVFEGGDSVTRNYDINYNYGELTVLPRPITVETNTNTWEYDGNVHSDVGFKILGSLVEGQETKVVLDMLTQITDVVRLEDGRVGNIENKFEIEFFYGVKKVTSNYEINYDYGILTITPLAIEITTDTSSWIYDGEMHYDIGHIISLGTLIIGQKSTLSSGEFTSITNVIRLADGSEGNIENIFQVKILCENKDCTQNYNISYIYGTLSIKPRQITVRPNDKTKNYDATPLKNSSFSIISTLGIVEGQFASITCSGSQTEIGSSENIITGVIIYSGNEDVTYNYDITLKKGSLEVRRRVISVWAGDACKKHDGTALTCSDYHLRGNGLVKGHELFAVTLGSQTDVGFGINSIIPGSIKITHNGADVTDYYDINLYEGQLHVWLKEITLRTSSAEKPYDGTPLTCNDYEIIGELFVGNTPHVNITGSIKYVGNIFNDAVIRIVDDYSGNDVTDSYHIIFDLGRLRVTGNSGGTDINLDGTIDRQPVSGGEGGSDSKAIIFDATSDTSGTVYFRIKSFGNYIIDGWENASPYLDGNINALQLMYWSLVQSGKQTNNILISHRVENLSYMLPYYAQNGYNGSLDDTRIHTDNIYSNYYINYVLYNYNVNHALSVKGTDYEIFEQAYYDYVIKTYLQLPESTRTKLLEIATKNNLKAESKSIISDVADFVKNSVKYDLNYNEYLGDVAIYFFTHAETGICQHYATAATAMFRALGIPARYVVGFVGNMSAGKTVEVSAQQAHAWVEVYITGAGWIQIEVTGAGEGGGEDGNLDNGNGEGKILKTISIKPIDVYKVYDGTPLYAENEVEGDDLDSLISLKDLLDLGYRYTVSVTGVRTEYGVSQSEIMEFILYDSFGRNVTEQYKILFKPGRIRIINTPIFIHLYSLQKYYDGTPLSYESQDYWIEEIPEGLRLDFNLSGSLINAGILKISDLESLPYTVYDKLDNNISDQYSLVFLGEPLRIDKRAIEITSASVIKTYDGTALTNNLTWISKGFFPPKYRYEATVIGTIVDVGSENNIISKIIIYDERGNDVTKNFYIDTVFGTLIIKDD